MTSCVTSHSTRVPWDADSPAPRELTGSWRAGELPAAHPWGVIAEKNHSRPLPPPPLPSVSASPAALLGSVGKGQRGAPGCGAGGEGGRGRAGGGGRAPPGPWTGPPVQHHGQRQRPRGRRSPRAGIPHAGFHRRHRPGPARPEGPPAGDTAVPPCPVTAQRPPGAPLGATTRDSPRVGRPRWAQAPPPSPGSPSAGAPPARPGSGAARGDPRAQPGRGGGRRCAPTAGALSAAGNGAAGHSPFVPARPGGRRVPDTAPAPLPAAGAAGTGGSAPRGSHGPGVRAPLAGHGMGLGAQEDPGVPESRPLPGAAARPVPVPPSHRVSARRWLHSRGGGAEKGRGNTSRCSGVPPPAPPPRVSPLPLTGGRAPKCPKCGGVNPHSPPRKSLPECVAITGGVN